MSKPNKVNKSNYDQAGRLTPDELASEQKKQANVAASAESDRLIGKTRGSDDRRPEGAPEE